MISYFGYRARFAGFGATCPPLTKFVQGTGCCLPAGKSKTGRRMCCTASKTHVCGPNADGLYWLNCKQACAPVPPPPPPPPDTGGDAGGTGDTGQTSGTSGSGGTIVDAGSSTGFDWSTLPWTYIGLGVGALILVSILSKSGSSQASGLGSGKIIVT